MTGDYILHVSAAGSMLRAFFARATDTVGEAARIHNTAPVVSAALGRLLTAGAILGFMQKNDEDLVTLIIKGDGPVGGLVVSAGKDAGVKGYAYNSDVELELNEQGKLDVAGALGHGTLSVIKDIGLKTPVSGQTELVSGEIAEDLTHYFANSEQTPTAVALGVLVERDHSIKQAGGFVLQLMPGCPDEAAEKLESKLSELPPLTTLMEEGRRPEDIMEMLLGEMDAVEIERRAMSYTCNCGYDRVIRALVSVGRKELTQILEQEGQATLHCHFCNKDYHFDRTAIEEVLNSI
ncbi:MAG: Hsp33 family molecular chaperone HslO [Defluviitaleaceae bacterium]|nr:Hsp33 family molecular chaperone HslO [Defluviitaleaceae bacterium]